MALLGALYICEKLLQIFDKRQIRMHCAGVAGVPLVPRLLSLLGSTERRQGHALIEPTLQRANAKFERQGANLLI